ncbi:MAG: hypothetical protein P8Y99_12500 [Calditrichaceae bacterium]
MITPKSIITILLILIVSGISHAQFLDSFDKDKIEQWFFFTGDGAANMDFVQKDNYARILVDATKDKYNVWWAIIKRDVSSELDLNKLKESSYELRVEARVRVGNAPRRINFMLNTQRTTNFHEHLMEYDIPDTNNWHTISYITKNFDAVPGDTVYVQLGMTDWGIGKYHVDLDYYRADVVDINKAETNQGELTPYHPPIPDISTFANHLKVTQDALINLDFPDVNFNNWHVTDQKGEIKVMTINANQWAILRWDLAQYKNSNVEEAGILELTTYSAPMGGEYSEVFGEDLGMEFNKIRVIEILAGKSDWDQNTVTYNNLTAGKSYSEIFNTQMIYDAEISEQPGNKNFITISRPVLERLINGKTKGLLIRPLGAINSSFYASENQNKYSPKLHFNVAK